MTDYHEQRRAEKLHCIFEARQAIVIEEIAREPHHEEVAGALIEDKVRHNAAVGAAQDRSDGKLRRGPRRAASGEISLARRVRSITLVPLHESL